MNQESALIRQRMRTPRSAAIAGILFSLLFTASLVLMWVSIPANPLGPARAVGLRKCIRPLLEHKARGLDGMRCALFLFSKAVLEDCSG